ncbi:MAG: NAD(P)-dependent alcohol dehydrogenase [Salinivirgaceae bacterium]|jgi:NADPH:quinone reductase-like Zn-dependent oxidoreductase|nr:NAD(P)-dependent alcohol dehydrogenase [Salinivirgaceae bacterium]
MKAIYYTKYGSVKNFALKEVEKPQPKTTEVLVKVHASSINSWDWDLVRGIPRIYRLMFGLFKPKYNIIGIDIAGTVEAIGSNVRNLKIGDEVYGDISDSGFGAFAEYACTRENLLALKPKNATFEQAAAMPHGGVLALQSVEYNGGIKPGQQVLINGAGGSTGPFAIQMAKLHGAIITCVDSQEKFELLTSLGADFLIDYKKEDYTKNGKQYDLVIDLMAHKSVFDYNHAIAPNGAFTIVGGAVRRLIQTAFIGALITKFTDKKIGLLMHKPCTENLERLAQLHEQGKIKTIIEKVYPIEDTPLALQYLGEGKSKGKLVIKIH